MHELASDVGNSGEAPWLPAYIAAGLLALEQRLAAEHIMDELDEPPRTADAA